MIEESYVSFDTARMLKEAGFDVPCNSYYELEDGEAVRKDCIRPYDHNGFGDTICSRPTLALAARWLRDEHKLHVSVSIAGLFDGLRDLIYWAFSVMNVNTALFEYIDGNRYDSYEEALEAGLQKAIKLITNENENRNNRC